MDTYDAGAIEAKWQKVWEDARAFEVPNPEPGTDRARKSYVLEMLPYPSGTLHMGHILVYTIGDVLTHFRRRNGMHVLRPMGYDSFGLPAENAAIREGGRPREIVERNIAHIRWEFKRLGYAMDWSREFSTHEPEYYRWTQWLFLKLYEAGLAYRKEAPVKWCPKDQVVLANEQVRDGRCEYCGAEVEARMMEQWFFRTTAYADELLSSMSELDWPERVLAMQRHWIGRSEGAEIVFRIDELGIDVPVFTTRPDTLFGATFFVIAPEHPLVEQLAERSPHADEIRAYARVAGAKRGEERAAADEKTGVFTGFYATNPVNGERLPIWVADYVLMDYGTGAIMAVPAHDERDYEFARAFDLPIRTVVAPAGGEPSEEGAFAAHTDDEQLVNSDRFSGLSAPEGARAIVEWLEGARERKAGRELPPARLGLLAPALLGLPDPGRLLRRVRDRAGARGRAAGAPARDRRLPAAGEAAAGAGRGLGARPLPALRRRRPARGRHDGHVRRLVLVLPALLRPAERRGRVRPADRRLLVPGRPLHRRRRPRDDAPDLRALLHEGAERPRPRRLPRAVPEVLRQRVDPARRLEDVEVEGATCSARTS